MEHVEKLQSNEKDSKSGKNGGDTSNNKWAILALASIPLVMTLGNSMLIPVLPAMEKQLNISSFQTSMILTVYSIVAIILIPIAGILSDHIGRKKVIIPSLIIAGIGGLISGWAAWKMNDAYWLILVGRAIQGIGAAGASPIVMPLVGDMFKNDDEMSTSLGIIETSNTFGKVLSPILGSLLAGFIWFLPFFSFPVFCLLSIILMIFLVKTKNMEFEPVPFKQFFANIKETFKNNGRWLYAIFIIGAILMFVLFGVLFYLSDTLEKIYDIKNVKKGFFLAIPLGALCTSSFITGKLIKENKILMKWLIFGGSTLTAISIAVLSFSDSLWFMIILFLFGGIGIGSALPCLDTLITEGIDRQERGTITSIYSSMRFVGVAAGPPAIAVLMKHAEKSLFYILSILALVAAIATFKAIKPDKK
ncbi:ACDE family multidrug resistance protein [Cytobacillus eiseniae]|uniref:ACDE family multidrug resistance protein n=1 Tax=Cytobacillus eiseniae TaxID=762947 RepID=A0ABS4R9H4_9BACI|nr:MFS transporter [Cytobacillus eiseniae]MBP2239544.1 ACDE family multidrug resistance protein [Cytobacillus eiseniae]